MSISLDTRDGVGLAQLGDTVVALWKAPATLDRWRYQLSKMESMAASRSRGIICLDLILDGSSPPDAALRQQLTSDFRRMGPKLRRFVVVPLGNSLWLSVVRTIVRGVLLVSGQSERLRVSASVQKGIDEVRGAATAETPSPEEVVAAVADLAVALGVELPKAA